MKIIKKTRGLIAVLILLLITACTTTSSGSRNVKLENLDGFWEGTVFYEKAYNPLTLEIEGATGIINSYSAKGDLFKDWPIKNVEFNPPKVLIEVDTLIGLLTFKGALRGNKITGEYFLLQANGEFSVEKKY